MSDERSGKKYSVLFAIALSIAVFLLGAFNLDNNCNWGDDYAAYMADGIAIAEGKYEEQIHTNAFLRFGGTDDAMTHVHSFGMPLIHSLVYRICGFDRTGFNNLYAYKLPSLIMLSEMCAVFYLFLRRRTDQYISALLAFALCCGMEFYYAIRNLGNDVMFMALTMLCIYETEIFSSGKKSTPRAAFTGVLLWTLVSVRLNGAGVLAAALLYHICTLIRNRQKPEFVDFIPYLVFAALFLVINCIIFPKPTSTSRMSDVTAENFIGGIEYYSFQIYYYFCRVIENVLVAPVRFVQRIVFPGKDPVRIYSAMNTLLTSSFLAVMLIGLFARGLKKDTVISILVAASFLITAGLGLGQGLRYLYNILPFLYMYFAYGLRVLSGLSKQKIRVRHGWIKALCSAALCIFIAVPIIKADIENIKDTSGEQLTAYSDSAVEAYNYIRKNVEKGSTVAFFKPRALYLNTEVLSFVPKTNGMKVSEGDYYLYYKPDPDFLLSEEETDNYTNVFENEDFRLLKKNKQ